MLALGYAALGQCPGLRPKFSWASEGSSIVFTDQTGAFVSDRVWDFGDGDSAHEVVETHTYTLAGDATVSLTLTVDGCVFSTSALVVHPGQSDDCFIQVTSAFTSEQVSNNQVQFFDASQGNGEIMAYLWTFGDDSLASSEDATHFYKLPGAYDVSHSIGAFDSLFQTVCVAGSVERILVDGNTSTCDSSLFLDLQLEQDGNTITSNAEAILFNPDLHITYWVWDYGDGSPEDITSMPQAQHYYPYGGDVQTCVQVWVSDTVNGDTCFARNCKTVTLPQVVAVEEVLQARSLRARPVPFNDELWLEGPGVVRGARLLLVDALGRRVLDRVITHEGSERCDTSDLPAGVYTAVVLANERSFPLRLLKQ